MSRISDVEKIYAFVIFLAEAVGKKKYLLCLMNLRCKSENPSDKKILRKG